MKSCLNCNKKLTEYQYKFCSNSCQAKKRQSDFIQDWQNGNRSGTRGLVTKNISNHLRNYLEAKYDNMCCLCGWKQVNLITGKVPLEVDHINGNAEDNSEKNLRLLCPNCHSLSPNFRNLNKGRGRSWRTKKYIRTPK